VTPQETLKGQMRECIFDLETDGFLDAVTKIYCFVIKDLQDGRVYRYSTSSGNISDGITKLSSYDVVIGHNAINYDVPVLKKLYPHLDFNFQVQDTLILSRLIYTDIYLKDLKLGEVMPKDLRGRHSLKSWGYRLKFYKGEFGETTDWKEFTPEMLEYCVQDVEVTHKLLKLLRSKNYSQEAIDLEHEVATIMQLQHVHGWAFDVKAGWELYVTLLSRREEIKGQLQGLFKPWWMREKEFIPKRSNVKAGYEAGCAITKVKLVEFNPSSRAHIADRLKNIRGWEPTDFTDKGEVKVDESVLSGLEYPEAKIIAESLMLDKRLGQLAEGEQAWLKLENKGRIHGSITTNGAVTGRATHHHPNTGQVPANDVPYGHSCRALWGASSGFVMLGADASGLELRCLSHYMAPWDGGAYGREVCFGDIHTKNQVAAGLPTRNMAKTFIYGYVYGAGDAMVGAIVGKGDAEGKKLKASFLKQTPALKKLKARIEVTVKERGYLIGLDGRQLSIRHKHAALNTLLQSAGAILCKKWICIFYKKLLAEGYKWGKDFAFVGWIHDELQLEVSPEIAQRIGELAKESIKEAGEYFKFLCPLDGEFKIGKNWSETH